MAYSYSTNLKYAVRFLNTSVWEGLNLKFDSFSQNRLLTINYCFVKNCRRKAYRSLIPNDLNPFKRTLVIGEALQLKKYMTNSQRYPLYLFLINNVVLCVARKVLNSYNFRICFISKLRKSISREITIKIIYFQRENFFVPS